MDVLRPGWSWSWSLQGFNHLRSVFSEWIGCLGPRNQNASSTRAHLLIIAGLDDVVNHGIWELDVFRLPYCQTHPPKRASSKVMRG